MVEPTMKTVVVVGTGIIGRGWIQVFSRAGCNTRIYDKDHSQCEKALSWVDKDLKADVDDGVINTQEAKERRALVSAHDDLKKAVSEAEYIQECGPESIDIKKAVYAEIDQAADPSTIIASSTSALDINEIAAGLPGISRCIMAHPFNPPHVIPAVEVLPTKKTDLKVVDRTIEFLKSVGQKPVLMKYFVPGFLANRIQAAVVREAIHLANSGIADVDAIDTVVREALGLRWALLGNFGVNHTNADGGIREYYTRFGETYKMMMNDLDSTAPSFDPDMIERIGKGVDAMEGEAPLSEICRWRDRMVRKIRALKEDDLHP